MAYNWLGAEFIPNAIAYALSFTVLFVGSITDSKTREVPDRVNYGLIASGIALNLLISVIFNDSSFIINSIIGLSIFFGIAYLMFYAGQWGGGDSKLLMGIGSMIGIDISFESPQFLAAFFINALFAGAVYGLLWSLFLAFKHKDKFSKEFSRLLSQNKAVKAKRFIIIILILLLVLLFFAGTSLRIMLLSLALVILVVFYLWVFVRAIEKSSMYKLVEPSKLTEGDWIVSDVLVNKQYICGPKDLGIGKRQIRKLIQLYKNGKVRKILIKEGIPFVPSFFIAFLITLLFGNPLMNWLG